MPKLKASGFIAALKKHVGHGYVYGAVGQVCTVALLKVKQRQYGRQMGNGYYQLNGDYKKGRCAKWLGRWVADCSGLIKAVRRDMGGGYRDVSAQGTFLQCSVSGPIASFPFIPGCCLFVYDASRRRMRHVGMYIGAGRVIQSSGVGAGVVYCKYGRGWSHWGLLDWLETDLPSEVGREPDETEVTPGGDNTNPKPDDPFDPNDPPTLVRGCRGQAVTVLQQKLKAAGVGPGPVDGIFGPLTLRAVRVYQKKNKLTLDGIVGPKTWGKLLSQSAQ